MYVKTEEMIAEERRLEDFLLEFETVLFCGVTRILGEEVDLTDKKFKVMVGATPTLAPLVELELATKISNSEWADCVELNLMVVRGRVAEELAAKS